jgi:YggT family protein
MTFLGQLLLIALDIYMWIIIVSVVVSWLIAFEVINASSPQAQNLVKLMDRATDPVYKPIRKFVPDIGGIDVTPIIVIFAIYILKMIVARLFLIPFWAY